MDLVTCSSYSLFVKAETVLFLILLVFIWISTHILKQIFTVNCGILIITQRRLEVLL